VTQGGDIDSARTSAFVVSSSAVVRTQAEYLNTFASSFFASNAASSVPADAGRLTVVAKSVLQLPATVNTGHPAGGRGAELDIAATKLAVLGGDAPSPGSDFVVLNADALNRVNFPSVLLGGTRTDGAGGRTIDIVSERVVVDSHGVLQASEIIFAAKGEFGLADPDPAKRYSAVEVRSGSVLRGVGADAAAVPELVIGAAGSGNGGLIRVSGGADTPVRRLNADGSFGDVAIQSGATVEAWTSETRTATGTSARLGGSVTVDASASVLDEGLVQAGRGGAARYGASSVALGDAPSGYSGLVFGSGKLRSFAGLGALSIRSGGSVDLYQGVDLDAAGLRLTLDSAGLAGHAGQSDAAVFAVGELTLLNQGHATAQPIASPGAGVLALTARRINFGAGDTQIAGFSQVTLTASERLQFQGTGGVTVQLAAPAAAGEVTVNTPVISADTLAVHSLTSSGKLTLTTPSTQPQAASQIRERAAQIRLSGASVDIGGHIELPGGHLVVSASGDLRLLSTAGLSAQGLCDTYLGDSTAASYVPGGTIELTSAAGSVRVDQGSVVDVSSPEGGKGGQIAVSAPLGMASLDGTLRGSAQASLSLDAADANVLHADRIKTFAQELQAAGFTDAVNLRVRGLPGGAPADLALPADATLTAHTVRLVADRGSISVSGTIDARGPKGGDVELYARDNVELAAGSANQAGGTILASATHDVEGQGGTDGRGGRVVLSAQQGRVRLLGQDATSSKINVSGDAQGPTPGAPGYVLLRAPRTGTGPGNGIAIDLTSKNIVGADRIDLEGVYVYSNVTSIAAGTTSGTSLGMSSVASDSAAYLSSANLTSMRAALDIAALPAYRLVAGVEVRGNGAISLATDWDLATARAGNEPGMLTIRAGGDLTLSNSLSDGFTNALPSGILTQQTSWSYRLVAGSDLTSADPLAVGATRGVLTVASGKFIRTGTGRIEIASSGDVQLGAGAAVYTAGRAPSTPPEGQLPVLTSFPRGGGDLSIDAGGTIRAEGTKQPVTDWFKTQGQLNPDGTFRSTARTRPAWFVQFLLDPGNGRPGTPLFRQGVGALGGGDVRLRAGGDIINMTAVVPTTAYVSGAVGTPATAAGIRVLGGGDLTVSAGGTVSDSLLLVSKGEAMVRSGGAFSGTIAMGDARFDLVSGGNLTVDSAFNPTAVPSNLRFFSYSADVAVPSQARITAVSAGGDILLGNSLNQTYPPSLIGAAPAGDVRIDTTLALYPSSVGQLELLAGHSVFVSGLNSSGNFSGGLIMSDASPTALNSIVRPSGALVSASDYQIGAAHAPGLLHAADLQPVLVYAGDDIEAAPRSGTGGQPDLVLPKHARIAAGRDIHDLWAVVQNLSATDVSELSAGRNVAYSGASGLTTGANPSTIEVTGPGRLVLSAGGSIDLATASGVISSGNTYNNSLPDAGADVTLIAGLGKTGDGLIRSPDYGNFAAVLMAPGSAALRDFQTQLLDSARRDVAFDIKRANPGLTQDEALALTDSPPYDQDVQARYQQALSQFAASPTTAQMRRIFFNELLEAGRAFSTGVDTSYARGYNAISLLFPTKGAAGEPIRYSGDINLFFSQIKTLSGGAIELLTPGGTVNAGLANPGTLAKAGSDLGIVTVKGGDIRGFVDQDFLVNQSRVFTLGGGDITLWSSNRNIDAGRGAKTTSATPPPALRVKDGRVFFDISGSVSGAGIGVLLTRDDVRPGDVDLIAPRGEVNAGEAGIRAAGNLTIAAVRVVGADTIQVGGAAAGVPTLSSTGLAGLGSIGSAGNEAARAAEQATQKTLDTAAAPMAKASLPSFITVEVISVGEENKEPARETGAPR
jgi:hypothetical protein